MATRRSNRTRGTSRDNLGVQLKARSAASFTKHAKRGSSLSLLPVIVSGPDSVSVPEGDAAVFHVEATSGDGSPLTYQWFERIGGSFLPTTDGGSLSGSTTDTLTIDPTVEGDDNRQFRCQVCNDVGCVFSGTATLDVQIITEVFFQGTIDPYDAVVDVPFVRSDAADRFSGTLTPFTYALTGTAWPAWANIDVNTGVVSGTPDALLSTAGHTITATDTGTNTAVSNTFTIDVIAASDAVSFTGNIANLLLDRNVPMTPLQTGLEFEGTELPFAFSVIGTPLPPSLSINTVNGVISGTPDNVAITAGHQVQVIDSALNTAVSNLFSIDVHAIAPTVDAGGPYFSDPGTPGVISAIVTPGSDPTPDILWTIDSGGAGTFGDATLAQTTFTGSEQGAYVLRCTVNPDDGPDVFDTAQFSTVIAYDFNGVDMYATHSSWDTLGDFTVYGSITFASTGATDDVVASTPPLVEFGRVGIDYHDGLIRNLSYADTSPIQGTDAKASSVGTIGPFDMSDGSAAFDYIHAADEDIIVGYLSSVAGILTLSANASELVVDGTAYVGQTMNVGQHYTVGFNTSGGSLTTVNSTLGMQNLEIQTNT